MFRGNLFLIAITVLVCASCATPGRESFDIARELERQKRLEDALPMYEDAVSKNGESVDFRSALASARAKFSRLILDSAQQQLNTVPLQYDHLRMAQGYVEKALTADPASVEARTMSSSIKEQMEKLARNAETSYSAANKALEAKQWLAALERLREIRAYYPSYLDIAVKIPATEEKALSFFLQEAEKNNASDDIDAMIRSLESAVSLQPGNQQVAASLEDARARNTAAVFLGKAEQAAADGKWGKAQFFLKRAQLLRPSGAEKERVAKLMADGGKTMLDRAAAAVQRKALYSAYTDLRAAVLFNPDSAKLPVADEIRAQLLPMILAHIEELDSAGYIGLALNWCDCAYWVSGSRKEINQKLHALKDKVRQRVVKKIAIMDFNSPTNNPDAGRLVTDSLLSYMTRNASGDMKILARDVLGALIKEIELGQAGLYDIESAKKSGKLKGTDVFIFGSLLQYSVEKSVEEGQKLVVAKVGSERTPNPHYTAWVNAHPRPSDEEKLQAPPPFLEKDRTETIRYKVATHRKIANVTISFRVIDVESGEVVITKTLKSKKEGTGSYSEGVEVAGIPYQRLELPPDTELLERAVDDAIEDLGHQVLSRFQNLQETCLNAAEVLKKKGEVEPVAEKYMDAIVAEEIKNIKSAVTETARFELDRLLKQAENYPI